MFTDKELKSLMAASSELSANHFDKAANALKLPEGEARDLTKKKFIDAHAQEMGALFENPPKILMDLPASNFDKAADLLSKYAAILDATFEQFKKIVQAEYDRITDLH